MPRKPRIPKYSLHKPSGRARIIVDGRHIWLGKYGSDESIERYNRIVAELASSPTDSPSPVLSALHGITVVEILAPYLKYAEGYYQKNGEETGQLAIVKSSLRPVQRLYGRSRTIFIGPKAQEILMPFLLRPAESYCFSPVDSVKQQHAKRTRTTPLCCGNRTGNNRVRKPKRKPRDCYDKNAYSTAVRRAIRKANEKRKKAGEAPLPRWTPNMLRHSAATEIRRQFDLEAVQSILGHANMNTSEIYAEKNMDLAREIARKIG